MQKLLYILLSFSLTVQSMEPQLTKKSCCSKVLSIKKACTHAVWRCFNADRAKKLFKQAIIQDDMDQIKELIECGVDPKNSNEDECRAKDYLKTAIKANNYRMTELLFKVGCMPREEHIELAFPGYHAKTVCSKAIQDLMLTRYLEACVHWGNREDLLERVIKGGSYDQVALVLKAGADPNFNVVGPLRLSVWYHAFKARKELIPLLNEYGARPTVTDFRFAMRDGSVDQLKEMIECHPFIVKGLQQHKAKKHKARPYVLNLFLNEYRVVTYSGTRSGLVNKKRKLGDVFSQELPYLTSDMIKYVHSLGVNVNWCNKKGQTALFQAINFDVMFALLECGALVEERDLKGQTLAHSLVAQASKEVDKSKRLLTEFLVTPLLHIKNVDNNATQKALFTALCCLCRQCPVLPLDLKIKIMDHAFDEVALNTCWLKYAQRLPLHAKVSSLQWNVLVKCLEKEDHTIGVDYKERYLNELVNQHMNWLRKFLNIKNNQGETAADLDKESNSLFYAGCYRNFVYNWRGLIDREYRYLLYTDCAPDSNKF